MNEREERERRQSRSQQRASAAGERAIRPAPGRPARSAGPSASDAIALQRAVGNREAARVIARWAAHPDKDKKGQFMTDGMATRIDPLQPSAQ